MFKERDIAYINSGKSRVKQRVFACIYSGISGVQTAGCGVYKQRDIACIGTGNSRV